MDDKHGRLAHYYNFSEDHKDLLGPYIDDSEDINRHLWNKHLGQADHKSVLHDTLEKHVKALDQVHNSYKTPFSFHVYTGLRNDPRSHVDENGVFHHPAYISTSLDRGVATGFAAAHRYFPENKEVDHKGSIIRHSHVLRLVVPQGHHGVYVGGHPDALKSEREFILPRGRNIRLIDHQQINTKDLIHQDSIHTIHTHHGELL